MIPRALTRSSRKTLRIHSRHELDAPVGFESNSVVAQSAERGS